MHGVLGQSRLNFLKKKFFNYKAGPNQSVHDVSSNLIRLQMIIRNIKAIETPTDLNVAFTLINSVDDEAYALIKFPFEEMESLILVQVKKRSKFVKQFIEDDQATEITANKAGSASRRKDDRKCFFCDKGNLKVKCFKWLATDEEKKYMKTPQHNHLEGCENSTSYKPGEHVAAHLIFLYRFPAI